jgi:hypothetical protein
MTWQAVRAKQDAMSSRHLVPVLLPIAALLATLAAKAIPPRITESNQPRDQAVGVGLPARFSVSALGALPLGYQWTRDGQPLPGFTSPHLAIPAATYGDAGRYAVTVSNAEGSVTSRVARLDVVPAAKLARLGGIQTTGWVYTLAVADGRAYVGVSGSTQSRVSGLEIFDVADAGAPGRLGGFRFAGSAGAAAISDVAVAGGRAYLAASGSGLQVLDVADPAQPKPLGSFNLGDSALDLVVQEPLAFVATGRGVQVLDVGNPAAVTRLASHRTPAAVYTLALSGSTLFLGATSEGVLALDVTDPAAPTLLSQVHYGVGVDTVLIAGRLLYGSGSFGPFTVDMTHPRHPRPLGRLDRHGNSQGTGRLGSLLFDGGRAAAGGPQQLHVVDAANPAWLTWIGQAATGGAVEAVETVDGRIYAAVSGAGVEIFALEPAADAPVVLAAPQPVQAVAGTAAEFRVEAAGGGLPGFQWFKNGTPLPGETNQVLRLPAVSAADVAEYSVTVANAAGTVAGGAAALSLLDPPVLRLESARPAGALWQRVSFGAAEGVQGELWGTHDFADWQPLWYGRFGIAPVELTDPGGTNAAARVYRLRLGAR